MTTIYPNDTALHGPGAARLVAYTIAERADEPHSHLVIEGEIECASGHCDPSTPAPRAR